MRRLVVKLDKMFNEKTNLNLIKFILILGVIKKY